MAVKTTKTRALTTGRYTGAGNRGFYCTLNIRTTRPARPLGYWAGGAMQSDPSRSDDVRRTAMSVPRVRKRSAVSPLDPGRR